jgi:hypothetical protein
MENLIKCQLGAFGGPTIKEGNYTITKKVYPPARPKSIETIVPPEKHCKHNLQSFEEIPIRSAVIIMFFKTRWILALFFAFGTLLWNITYVSAQKTNLRIKGSVVMYDVTPAALRAQSDGASKLYVVKVFKTISGSEKSVFIFVVTIKELKEKKFDGKRLLEFDLTRARGCDSPIRGFENLLAPESKAKPIPALKYSEGVDPKDIPRDEVLPCYLFR